MQSYLKVFALLLTASTSSISLPVQAQDANAKNSSPGPSADGKKAEAPSIFLPSWSPDSFDFGIGPILGFRYRSSGFGAAEYDTTSSEIGLGLRLRGIPIVPHNPGVTLEPYGSYTWGNRTQKLKSAALTETESSGLQRYWYGFIARFYFKFLRYSLDLGQGKIAYDDQQFDDIEADRIVNDFALLVVPHLSTHYTLSLFSASEGENSKPTIEEVDHWLHARLAFSLFDFWFDIGPGWTTTEYSGRPVPTGPMQKLATVDTSYMKALTALNIIWKLGATGSAKYVYKADKVAGLYNTIDQLPHETLSQSKSLANLPSGSLEASLFFGIRGLMAGVGVGWQTYYLELNHDGEDKQILRDQGIVVTYDAGF